ncbi:hypothetical protein ACIP2Y_16210 [Streptomyces sviceus]|uniref:hypothetical protein n=1 Tax=Streptomyces sviceus TaxID=285530 RepID=UPI00380A36CC
MTMTTLAGIPDRAVHPVHRPLPALPFDYNLGVLSWRVASYSYGTLGTDRYPPFSLGEAPDCPARLDIAYPEHLSRGLVLVKWRLPALLRHLFDLVLGLDRWVLRVAAYVSLMTGPCPPFRLEMGGTAPTDPEPLS